MKTTKIAMFFSTVLITPLALADDITITDNGGAQSFIPQNNSDNNIVVDSDLKNLSVAGSYYVETDKVPDPINFINNNITVNKANNANVAGGLVSTKSNIDVTIDGTVNINDGSLTSAKGVHYLGYQENINSDNKTYNVDLNGSVNINGGNVGTVDGVYTGFYITERTLGLSTVLDQNGEVSVSDGKVGSVVGNNFYIYADDHNTNKLNSNTLDLTLKGTVNISGGDVGSVVGTNFFTNGINSNQNVILDVSGNVGVTGGNVGDVSGVTFKGSDAGNFRNTAKTGSVVGNVNIGGGDISGNVYGIKLDNASFSNNDITYSGNVSIIGTDFNLASDKGIYGVYNTNSNAFLGVNYVINNTFYMDSKPITVGSLGNFGQYNFVINNGNNSVVDSNDSLVTVTSKLANDTTIRVGNETEETYVTTRNRSKVGIIGIGGDVVIKDGSHINLVALTDDAVSGHNVIDNKTTFVQSGLDDVFDLVGSNEDVKVGLVRKTNLTYKLSEDGKRVIAVINDNDISTDPTEPGDGGTNPGDGSGGDDGTKPVDPSNPGGGSGGDDGNGGTKPVDPTDPGDDKPVDPTPTDPVDPTPTDPVDPKPTDPVDPEPEEPTKPVDPSNPGDGSVVDVNEVNRVLPSLENAYLNTLNSVARGADAITNILSGEHKPAGTVTPIAVIDGGRTKYKDSTKIVANDYRLIVGTQYHILDNWFVGLVAERGQSNYSATTNDIYGSGHSINYGITAFTKYSKFIGNNEGYVDGAIGFGRTSTKYNSDLTTGSGKTAEFDIRGNYVTAQLGAGYIYNIDVVGFDTSVRYFYTHLKGSSFTIDGDTVKLNNVDSNRVQFKEKVNYHYSDNFTLSVAGFYEYELDSKVSGNIDGVNGNSQSLKGSTGGVQLGVRAKPLSNKYFEINFNVIGYAGQREGVTGSLLAKYNF